MKKDENVATYFLRVDEILNPIRELGETSKYFIVVKKVLRSLLDIYDHKVSSLEEYRELKTMKMDELQGIPIAHEMRKEQDKPLKHEVVFKSLRREILKEHQTSVSLEEESNFVRKLKNGFGKYKGKLHFKCFDCGRVGHFSAKCPYKDKNKGT